MMTIAELTELTKWFRNFQSGITQSLGHTEIADIKRGTVDELLELLGDFQARNNTSSH
jgi:hypothetical protein